MYFNMNKNQYITLIQAMNKWNSCTNRQLNEKGSDIDHVVPEQNVTL